MINQHNSLIGFLVYDAQRAIAKSLETALKPYEMVVTAQPVTVDAADRLIEGIDQADLDTFVAVLAKLKENADNYSNNG